jgi:Ni2+-binding GTPase involved in maturation of urease and hydrogenase
MGGPPMAKARYLMTGGFLGAGKTTLINRFAGWLTERGHRVGLITNDQGQGLVDTALGRAHQFPTEEIAGGCFCCRFSSLMEAARVLRAKEAPGIFLAEPVGSCTDLAATVGLPLQQIYGDAFDVSPLSVVIDPVRARRILGLGPEVGARFSPQVTYIYLKQLEEAEAIVINKLDLISPEALSELTEALRVKFPQAQIFPVSARDGTGCEAWFGWTLITSLNPARILGIDYQKYAEGEALLGWLNMTVQLTGEGDEWDGNALLVEIATEVRTALAASEPRIEIAHLKMTLTPPGDPSSIAAVNLVATDREPELSHTLADPLEEGELLLNLRAEGDPTHLDAAVRLALVEVAEYGFGLTQSVTHAEHFRPSAPQPEHRVEVL